jgi:hypothetical protein
MKLSRISNGIDTKLIFLIFFFYIKSYSAQPALPQRTITVAATQKLDFGAFFDFNGTGGTISVDWQGNRTTTGSIGLVPSISGRPALFNVKLCQGRNVTIMYSSTVTLNEIGGASLELDIGPTEKGGIGATFATENNCNFITILRVGGTLHIPAGVKVTSYTGDFEISFDQQ